MNDFSQCPTEGAIGLLSLLIRNGRGAETRLNEALAAAGLTFTKWQALDMLVKSEGPVPLKSLPEKLGCVKSNITQLVDKLEAEGAVRRIADPCDRRVSQLELTEPGRAVHKAGREALESATQALFAGYGHADNEALRDLLLRLEG